MLSTSQSHVRWAWQSIPILQLPPVKAGVVEPPLGKRIEGPSQPPPRGALARRMENRVLQVKQDNGVENALRKAEEILGLRHRWGVRWTYRRIDTRGCGETEDLECE